jgi:hypothetical protein
MRPAPRRRSDAAYPVNLGTGRSVQAPNLLLLDRWSPTPIPYHATMHWLQIEESW